MKQTLTILLLTFAVNTMAAVPSDVICKTPRENVVIKMHNDKLNITGRFPAQAVVQRTTVVGNTLKKIFFLGGEKHTIFIGDKNKFDDFNDSLTIQSNKGHEVTYSLSCERV